MILVTDGAGFVGSNLATALARRHPENGDRRARQPAQAGVGVSDCSRLFEGTDRRPRRSAQQTLADLNEWIDGHASELQRSLGIGVGSAR